MTTQIKPITPAPATVEFVLPFSGIEVIMRRPTVKDQREAMRQTDTANSEEIAMVVMSKCATFNGEYKNWNDFNYFDLADYGEIADVYRGMITGATIEKKTTAPQA